ncbi:hypothetical protein BOX15_Mlig020934g1 [Macrostomum lignano]|uniref:Uncharacterized protein n=2 Tax=Macrostomum lignano TaxID=282301 RepID=A0A267GUQ9_9PLAT|nr:hypothetical protein BOX15_Mlig020934g1 [Macrostomum lignano]
MSGKAGGAAVVEATVISQYKVDYKPWQMERVHKVKNRPQWEPPTGRVEGRSETAEQFLTHKVQPRVQRERAEWHPPAEKFTGESVNRTDFQPKYLPKEQAVRPKDEIERTKAPFEGEPLSREEFRSWQQQPRYRHEQPAYHKPEGAMETSTSYSADFTAGKTIVRLPPIRPAIRMGPVKPFQGVSESAERYRDFQPADMAGAKQESCRPQQQYRPPSRPLEGQSSYTGDFAVDTQTRPERTLPVRHSGELKLAAEPMETGTTCRGDFKPPDQIQRRQPIQHGGELHCPTDAFSGRSTQQEDFSPRWQPRREPIRHNDELRVPADPFVARTVMKEDYLARPGQRPEAVRQRGELQLSSEPMFSTTTSRAVYTLWPATETTTAGKGTTAG